VNPSMPSWSVTTSADGNIPAKWILVWQATSGGVITGARRLAGAAASGWLGMGGLDVKPDALYTATRISFALSGPGVS
jgi:hypothetical protein